MASCSRLDYGCNSDKCVRMDLKNSVFYLASFGSYAAQLKFSSSS